MLEYIHQLQERVVHELEALVLVSSVFKLDPWEHQFSSTNVTTFCVLNTIIVASPLSL